MSTPDETTSKAQHTSTEGNLMREPEDPKRPMKNWPNVWLRAQFVAALDEVTRSSAELAAALEAGEGVYDSWFWTPPTLDGALQRDPELDAQALATRAWRMIESTDYIPGEERSRPRDPSEEERTATRRRFAVYDLAPGIVAASEELLVLVDRFNEARTKLDPLLTEMNRADRKVGHADDRSGKHIGKDFLRHVLMEIDRSDLNLHRVRRRLQRLNETPIRLGFTWAIQRRIRRIDLETVQARLDSLRDATDDYSERVHADIAIIAALRSRYTDPNEQPALAHITAPHRNPKINLVLSTGGPTHRRKLIRAILPVFYPGHPDASLVPFTPLKPLPDDADIEGINDDPVFGANGKLKRNDTAYEHAMQLLDTLPVYCHKEVFTEFRGAQGRHQTGGTLVSASTQQAHPANNTGVMGQEDQGRH